MLNKKPIIVLPKKISVLRDIKNQKICTNKEEYSIYYKNIIYPYSKEYDIQIECKYGKNLGDCWRIDEFSDDMGIFDFTLNIYGDFGKLISSKSCKMEIFEKKSHDNINLLCIGDSMTRSEVYILQAVNKAKNIKTAGIRNISCNVNHEGRGGWTCEAYFEKYDDDGWGVSPFLFPKNYSGKEYFGSKVFWERVNNSKYNTEYSYIGTFSQKIKDGMVCFHKGSIYRYVDGKYKEEEKNPEFEFSFEKYIERYKIKKPDIVSLLFGANEFQTCKYENAENEIRIFINNLKRMIESIKQFDKDIKIIVNLPVCGGDQYSWGSRMGCVSSVKQYDYCIKMAGLAILNEFDERRDENIFVCPMIAVCDPYSGFPWDEFKSNIYSDRTKTHISNWVHPSDVGYKQMGDALAGVITDIRDN